jgi:hypothetical protein
VELLEWSGFNKTSTLGEIIMRSLNYQEIDEVGGGFQGTQIPFTNSFISGSSWPGGAVGAWMAVPVAFNTGWQIGNAINQFNESVSDMSLGEAIFRTQGDS